MSGFVIHQPGDSVGVATEDLESGAVVRGRYRDSNDGDPGIEVELLDVVPLGHKLALADMSRGAEVIEYGVAIGVATEEVAAGRHVHTHNLKGQRWA